MATRPPTWFIVLAVVALVLFVIPFLVFGIGSGGGGYG